jgi:hypothetical protein
LTANVPLIIEHFAAAGDRLANRGLPWLAAAGTADRRKKIPDCSASRGRYPARKPTSARRRFSADAT